MTKTLLKKGGYCTDIHFGKKANSQLHNEDCLRYLDWFCQKVKDEKCDYVAFLGDWNENRSALNVATLNYSYKGAKKLNDLGLPVYFVVGNHDLYHRHSREVHSVVPFNEFSNFILIENPTLVEEIDGKVLFVPYLFHEEYEKLAEHLKVPFWAGHFEFKGFEVTGYGMKMPTGPDPKDYHGPDHIVSGHFHKRQADENVIYIGNCFPMDFGDAGDTSRGMMTYEHTKKEMLFHDWDECPKYVKVTLSSLLDQDSSVVMYKDARVKCIVDIPVTFEESTYIRQKFTEDYSLREFVMEESMHLKEALTETKSEVDWEEHKLSSVDDLVVQMLRDIESEHINNQKLVEIYRDLTVMEPVEATDP